MRLRKFYMICASVALIAFLAAGSALAEKPIIIGAPLPLTGPYASDGEQMKMALELAVHETNAKGGLVGRKLEILYGDVGGLEPEKIKAVGERLVGKGADVILTGYDDAGVDTKVFGQYDIPYLHANAMTLCTEPVAKNPQFRNCFQYVVNDRAFGVNAAKVLFEIPKDMGWKPPNKKVAVIKVDYAYNIEMADSFRDLAKMKGYEIVMDEITAFGMVEWGPILSKINRAQPAFVTFWNLDPTDAARFMKQFYERFGDDGINALVYMQYTPSIPEFLSLAGEASNGLLWSTTFYAYGKRWDDYQKRWTAFYKKPVESTHAFATRDGFDIWAQAVERAGCADCYKEIVELIRGSVYDGIGGVYVFDPYDNSAVPGDYIMPFVWRQIWNGKNKIVAPNRFKENSAQKPIWMK